MQDPPQSSPPRALARIDLDALRHNYDRLEARADGARVVTVIKADGYGQGLRRVAAALERAEILAVATLAEARCLRDNGERRRLLLLQGFIDAAELGAFQALELEPVIHSREQIEILERQPNARWPRLWLKLDTGMHRLGFDTADCDSAYRRLKALPEVGEIILMSHLANADRPGKPGVAGQIEAFDHAAGGMAGAVSLANSAATWSLPDSRRDYVRPGLMLYGVSPFADTCGLDLGLRPVMSLYSRLIAVQERQAGDAVGYGWRYTCPRDMRLGVVAIGYGDGYPWHARNGTPVLVNGRRAALAGAVSMDMLTIDLSEVEGAKVGDRVLLWGDGLPVEEVAAGAGTIPWALLCGVTARVEFRYTDAVGSATGAS